MTVPEIETYPRRRFRLLLVRLVIIFAVLIVLGLLSHRPTPINRIVWKSAPYGNMPDSMSIRAGN